jgi:hypothetical protein
MATTIQQSFLLLKKNLEISDLQETTVSTRQKAIRGVIESGLTVLDSFLTGSYARKTMIAPLKEADVDIFVVLNSQYFHRYQGQNGGPAGLLDLVKSTLKKTYTRTPDISRNGQAVSIRFEDFEVDVIPGFDRQGGGYLIPNSTTRSWLSTDPKRHVEIMSAENLAHDGQLVPLIKMVKGWNKGIDKYFRSFHLEVLALEILHGVKISDFPSGVRYYFDRARTVITKKNLDPAGYGDDIGRYISGQTAVQEAVEKFQLAYDRAAKAEDFARRGLIEHAVTMWKKVFGDYFPAYG